jgi:hypothetical protein
MARHVVVIDKTSQVGEMAARTRGRGGCMVQQVPPRPEDDRLQDIIDQGRFGFWMATLRAPTPSPHPSPDPGPRSTQAVTPAPAYPIFAGTSRPVSCSHSQEG